MIADRRARLRAHDVVESDCRGTQAVTMRARLHDPFGPRIPRLIVPLLGAACMAVAVYWRLVDGPPFSACFFVGLALTILGSLVVGRHAPRGVSIVVTEGGIRIRHAGVLRQTLRARNVVAAYVSESPQGVALSLAYRGRAHTPIVLALAPSDARSVCEALCIGRRGFGTLSWAVLRRDGHIWSTAIRVAGAVCALCLAAMAAAQSPEALVALPTFLLVVPLPVLALAFAIHARVTRARGCLALNESAVRVPVGDGTYRVPYASIVRVDDKVDGLRLVRAPASRSVFARIDRVRHARNGMTVAERAIVILQIETAAKHAREAAAAPDISATSTLARRSDEGHHAWLMRLEAAAQLISAGAAGGYRGNGIAEGDLWVALESHEASAEIRAAAARVLSRVAAGDATHRINAIVSAMRDGDAAKRIRVAMDPDLDAACQALDELDPILPLRQHESPTRSGSPR